MSVTDVRKDPASLTLTMTCEFAASPERVWQLWADPRQLERWWGPPTYPATVTTHDLRAGGRGEYYMTGPQGDTHGGYWIFDEVEPPRTISLRDGFLNPDGSPNDELPGTSMQVVIEPIAGGRTRMRLDSRFPSLEAMEQLVAMGMEEGLKGALGQIDAILAEEAGAEVGV